MTVKSLGTTGAINQHGRAQRSARWPLLRRYRWLAHTAGNATGTIVVVLCWRGGRGAGLPLTCVPYICRSPNATAFKRIAWRALYTCGHAPWAQQRRVVAQLVESRSETTKRRDLRGRCGNQLQESGDDGLLRPKVVVGFGFETRLVTIVWRA